MGVVGRVGGGLENVQSMLGESVGCGDGKGDKGRGKHSVGDNRENRVGSRENTIDHRELGS